MKITKAKYNWLVAQYNYRKNKEEIIEISDEEYERLTNNQIIIDEIPNDSIYIEKIISPRTNNPSDVETELNLNSNYDIINNSYTTYSNKSNPLSFSTLKRIYAKYNNDTYKEITPQIKYYLDKNIGILKRISISKLEYYPPEEINENIINLKVIGEYNGHKFNTHNIKLYDNTYYFNSYAETYIGDIYFNGQDAYNDVIICTLSIKPNNKCNIAFHGNWSFDKEYNDYNCTVVNNVFFIYLNDINDYVVRFTDYAKSIEYFRGDLYFGPNIVLPMVYDYYSPIRFILHAQKDYSQE